MYNLVNTDRLKEKYIFEESMMTQYEVFYSCNRDLFMVIAEPPNYTVYQVRRVKLDNFGCFGAELGRYKDMMIHINKLINHNRGIIIMYESPAEIIQEVEAKRLNVTFNSRCIDPPKD